MELFVSLGQEPLSKSLLVTLIVFLKAKGYPFKVLLKRTRGLVLKEKFLFGISAFGIFRMILLQVM
jgi:hypothetical protein